MPKKINRNGNSFKAVRKFTDREEPRKAFWDKYKSVPMIYHNFYTEKNGEFV